MAITATATQKTKKAIINVLRLQQFKEITQSPNKSNIAFAVRYMDKKLSLLDHFQWLIRKLKEKESNATGRVIIYCQTVKQCSTLYSLFVQELGRDFLCDETDPRKRLVEMLHSLSPKSMKEIVLQEMGNVNGYIKVLICTIAFGMGVNCKAVNTIIHFGPSKSVEAYIQESGRAGRDGQASKAILLYQSIMLMHVDKDMREYARGKFDCRRKYLIDFFQESPSSGSTSSNELCCDLSLL